MIIAADCSALVLIVNPEANPPVDPATGLPLTRARERIEAMLSSITSDDRIIVPAPAFAEVLVRAGTAGPQILAAVATSAAITVRPFGQRAALELAALTREALRAGKKRGGSQEPWQKVKYDRQIVAVAKVEQVDKVYADDAGVVAFAREAGIETFSTWDLPEPPEPPRDLFADMTRPVD